MRKYSRRQFIKRTSQSVFPVMLLPQLAKSWAYPTNDYQLVDTPYGKLRGYRENGVNIFKGIPYAGEVSGAKRFQKAAPVEPWTGIRDALQLGHPSVQPPSRNRGANEPEASEDCLVLNIWTPANDGKKRPVMVYNHGGGFRSGSAGSPLQDGSNLARMFDVVVVATNHRLGLLGFLYLDELGGEEYKGSGNRGIQDIAIALKWVNENIEQFGGDPANVMIFGESGGGMKTSCLYAMPEAAPYFNKVSIESGPAIEIIHAEDAAQTTRKVLEYLQISEKNWKKILEVPAEKLLAAQQYLSNENAILSGGFNGIGNLGVGNFGAVKDNELLPFHPFEPTAPDISKNKPLLTGWNEDEYIFFAMVNRDVGMFSFSEEQLKNRLKNDFNENAGLIWETYHEAYPDKSPTEIYVAIRSHVIMGLGTMSIAERKTVQGGAPVYLYNFGYKSDAKIPGTPIEFGAMHAMDIPFKFYNAESTMAGTKPERFEASKNMASFWAGFARTGKPIGEGQPEWPAFNLQNHPLMRIDAQCSVINNRYTSINEMWKNISK